MSEPVVSGGTSSPEDALPLDRPPRRGSRLAAAIAPLFVGVLLGFIGGYFAAGGGRPGLSGAGMSSSAVVPAGSAGRGRIEGLRAELLRDPENPKLWTAVANAYYDREDWDHAVEAYQQALRKAPKDAAVLSDLGAAFRNRGEFQRSLASFEKSRQADPEHWQALLNIVLVDTFDRKDAAGAQKAFDELKRRYPDIPNIDKIQEQISRLRAS